MSKDLKHKSDHHQKLIYQIRIKGHLKPDWSDWFGQAVITQDDEGHTLITGLATDQAALHAWLRKVRDLGLPLISVQRLEPGQRDTAEGQEPADAQ